MKPTLEFYNLFQFIYDYFNQSLFNNELPNCMIVITRKTHTMGYYSNERWVNKEKIKSDELAINPMYFRKSPIIEVLQTIVHEMAHAWQWHFGTPSRRSYHNKEWGAKMREVGLMPSNTGKPGGKTTGQQMMDYPLKDGKFLKACAELINNPDFNFSWYDRTTKLKLESIKPFPIDDELEDIEEEELTPEESFTLEIKNNLRDNLVESEVIDLLFNSFNVESPIIEASVDSSKSKYRCPECKTNIWGKMNLFIICGYCECAFEKIEN